MPAAGFVTFEPRIPLDASGFGPRAMALAVRHGDRLVMSVPPTEDGPRRAWTRIEGWDTTAAPESLLGPIGRGDTRVAPNTRAGLPPPLDVEEDVLRSVAAAVVPLLA